jgi:hypothetical protein
MADIIPSCVKLSAKIDNEVAMYVNSARIFLLQQRSSVHVLEIIVVILSYQNGACLFEMARQTEPATSLHRLAKEKSLQCHLAKVCMSIKIKKHR